MRAVGVVKLRMLKLSMIPRPQSVCDIRPQYPKTGNSCEELLTETNHEILRHLDTCPVCRADLAARRTLRASVRRAFDHADELKTRPEFVTQLHRTLREPRPRLRGVA